MKLKLLVLALLMWGYWSYLHDFQSKAVAGVNNLKSSYEQVTNVIPTDALLVNQE